MPLLLLLLHERYIPTPLARPRVLQVAVGDRWYQIANGCMTKSIDRCDEALLPDKWGATSCGSYFAP